MMKMKITHGKGIHLKFDNGVTLSIQIGGGNYCDNYGEPIGGDSDLPASRNAEIAVWGRGGKMVELKRPDEEFADTVDGRIPVLEIFSWVDKIENLQDGICGDELSQAICDIRFPTPTNN